MKKHNSIDSDKTALLGLLLTAGIAALVMDGLMGFANDFGAWLGCLITGFVVFCLSYMLYAIRSGQVQPWCGCEFHCFSAKTLDPLQDAPKNHGFNNNPTNSWDYPIHTEVFRHALNFPSPQLSDRNYRSVE